MALAGVEQKTFVSEPDALSTKSLSAPFFLQFCVETENCIDSINSRVLPSICNYN